jgi:glycosyltransferase involved in cell wall biosynthesis
MLRSNRLALATAVQAGKQRLNSAVTQLKILIKVVIVKTENILTFRNRGLVIIDDYFPRLATAFRVAEFNRILEYFEDAVLYSTLADRTSFSNYAKSYPKFANRVRKFHPVRHLKGSGAYAVFLNNIFGCVEHLERHRLPFVFELYPGGGFRLNNAVSDAHLRRVFRSSMFRKVIVTQNITRDYLLHNKFCSERQIELIFGVVVLSNILNNEKNKRVQFEVDKDTFDICFVANKYTPRGLDKGYDRFIACAEILSARNPQARFHIVGEFTEKDIEIREPLQRVVTFYGPRVTSFFPQFYARMDLILSPNVPFAFVPGAFDGFPTGCCIEAALCGTALFICDELSLNDGRFKDGRDLVIIPRDPERIAEIVERYIRDPEQLKLLAANGQRAVRNLFDQEVQMTPRLRILDELLKNG